MTEYRLILDYTPFPQARHRTSRFHTYDPSKTKKDDLRALIREQWRYDVLDGPITLKIDFGMPVPKSISKKKRSLMIGQPHIKKPDKDNIEKALLDSMEGIVFKNDCLVWDSHTKKLYVEHPMIEIIVQI